MPGIYSCHQYGGSGQEEYFDFDMSVPTTLDDYNLIIEIKLCDGSMTQTALIADLNVEEVIYMSLPCDENMILTYIPIHTSYLEEGYLAE